jgi:hypothetical protein
MTHPRAIPALTPESFPPGRVAFRSWILLFGVVPVEYDDVTLVELVAGRGFREASRMMLVREWRHSREVSPEGAECCSLRDEVALVPRWRPTGPLLYRAYRLVFALRHRAAADVRGRGLAGSSRRRGKPVERHGRQFTWRKSCSSRGFTLSAPQPPRWHAAVEVLGALVMLHLPLFLLYPPGGALALVLGLVRFALGRALSRRWARGELLRRVDQVQEPRKGACGEALAPDNGRERVATGCDPWGCRR